MTSPFDISGQAELLSYQPIHHLTADLSDRMLGIGITGGALYLLSEAASFINGEVIHIDGGIVAAL